MSFGGVRPITWQVEVGCAARPYEIVLGSVVVALNADGGTVSAIAESGTTKEIYRDASQPRITPELRTALEIAWQGYFDPPPPASIVEESIARLGAVGDALPSWQGVVGDPDGRLWLQKAVCPGAVWPTYEVVSLQGTLLGTFATPERMSVLAVRGDDILMVREDNVGTEHLELFRLQR
jgi:hypothetical protein